MRTTVDIKNNLNLISEIEGDSTFQILQYNKLKGIRDINSLKAIDTINKADIYVNQIRIILDNSEIKVNKELVSFMKGNITINNDNEEKDLWKLINIRAEGKEEAIPILKGRGEVFLKVSLQYFTLIELFQEEVECYNSMFYACQESVEIYSLNKLKDFEEDDDYKLKLKGSGIIALKMPIPDEEIIRCKLYKNSLLIDEELVLLTSGNIKKRKSRKYEGVIGNNLVVYEGVGEIWINSIKDIYSEILESDSDDDLYEEIE